MAVEAGLVRRFVNVVAVACSLCGLLVTASWLRMHSAREQMLVAVKEEAARADMAEAVQVVCQCEDAEGSTTQTATTVVPTPATSMPLK